MVKRDKTEPGKRSTHQGYYTQIVIAAHYTHRDETAHRSTQTTGERKEMYLYTAGKR